MSALFSRSQVCFPLDLKKEKRHWPSNTCNPNRLRLADADQHHLAPATFFIFTVFFFFNDRHSFELYIFLFFFSSFHSEIEIRMFLYFFFFISLWPLCFLPAFVVVVVFRPYRWPLVYAVGTSAQCPAKMQRIFWWLNEKAESSWYGTVPPSWAITFSASGWDFFGQQFFIWSSMNSDGFWYRIFIIFSSLSLPTFVERIVKSAITSSIKSNKEIKQDTGSVIKCFPICPPYCLSIGSTTWTRRRSSGQHRNEWRES